MEKANTNKWIGIIITLVIGLSIGAVAGIFINANFFPVKCQTTNTDNLEKNDKHYQEAKYLDVLSDVVQNNFEKFDKAAGNYGGALENYFKENKITAKDIDNSLVYATIAATGLMKDGMTEAEFEELVKKYYGEDYKYEHKQMTVKICAPFNYDESDKKYHSVTTSCGGAAGPHHFLYSISQAVLIDDELTLTVRVLFPGEYDDTDEHNNVRYYSDAKHEKVIKDISYTTCEKVPYRTQELFRKGGTYKFVMKKESGDNYSFVSSEPVK